MVEKCFLLYQISKLDFWLKINQSFVLSLSFFVFLLKILLMIDLNFIQYTEMVAVAAAINPKMAVTIMPPVPGSKYAWELDMLHNKYIKLKVKILILFIFWIYNGFYPYNQHVSKKIISPKNLHLIILVGFFS